MSYKPVHPLLAYLAPIRPGHRFAGHFRLNDIQGEHDAVLQLTDERKGKVFAIHVQPADRKGGALIRTPRLKLAWPNPYPPDRETERLVRVIGRILEQNLVSTSEAEFQALFTQSPGPSELVPVPAEQVMELLVGLECSSNCLFCSDRPDTRPGPEKAHLLDVLQKGYEQGFRGLEFGGLEPTSRRDLHDLIAAARSIGFKSIQVISNGERLADSGYLRELFDAGLSMLVLSIHAADEATETTLTRCPGLFAKKQQALKNLQELLGSRAAQRQTGRFFRSNTVLARPNLEGLQTLIDWLDTYEPSALFLHYPWINGQAQRHFAEIVPSYADVEIALGPLKARLNDENGRLSVLNLPPCIGRAFASRQITHKNILVNSESRMNSSSDEICTDPMDSSLTHAEPCRRCQAVVTCPGISRHYLSRYGADDLRPF